MEATAWIIRKLPFAVRSSSLRIKDPDTRLSGLLPRRKPILVVARCILKGKYSSIGVPAAEEIYQ
jgi:hypothetical protein